MTDPLQDYLAHLRRHDLAFEVASELRCDEDHDPEHTDHGDSPRSFADLAPHPIIEEHDAAAGLRSDHATMAVALEIAPIGAQLAGKRVLELGCGTGLLAIQTALFGAEVIGTDVDAEALELARRNARLNEVEIDLRLGASCEPLRAGEHFDFVVANLPHKPSLGGGTLPVAQDGGPDGTKHFDAVTTCLTRSQKPGDQILFFLHSLPHPRLLKNIGAHYALELRAWKLRWLAENEYAELIDHFRSRCEKGSSFMHRENDREALVACVWRATRRGG